MTVFDKLETDHNATKHLLEEKFRLIDKLDNQLKAFSNKVGNLRSGGGRGIRRRVSNNCENGGL